MKKTKTIQDSLRNIFWKCFVNIGNVSFILKNLYLVEQKAWLQKSKVYKFILVAYGKQCFQCFYKLNNQIQHTIIGRIRVGVRHVDQLNDRHSRVYHDQSKGWDTHSWQGLWINSSEHFHHQNTIKLWFNTLNQIKLSHNRSPNGNGISGNVIYWYSKSYIQCKILFYSDFKVVVMFII